MSGACETQGSGGISPFRGIMSDSHWHTRHVREHMGMKSDQLRCGNYRLYRLYAA